MISPSPPNFVLSESDKSARQGEVLQVRGERWLAVFIYVPLTALLGERKLLLEPRTREPPWCWGAGGTANTPAPALVTCAA